MFLVADVADPGGLLNAIVWQSKTLPRTLSTHTLATITAVVLKGLKTHSHRERERERERERAVRFTRPTVRSVSCWNHAHGGSVTDAADKDKARPKQITSHEVTKS